MNVERLPLSRVLAYAAPGFALAIPLVPVFTFLPTLYARDMGLGLARTGTVLFVARAVDFLIDPLIGLGSDRIKTRFGRRKPWIVVGAIAAGAALVFLFAPQAGASASYLFLWLAILYLGFTAVQVPYTAWGAELVSDYHERTRITGMREGLTLAGIVATGALPVVATLLGFSDRRGMIAIALLAILCGGPAIAWLVWRVPEGRARQDEPGRGVDLRAMIANLPFLRLFCAWFVNGLATGVPAVLFPLYLQHGLAAGQMARGVMIFAYFAAGACAIPLWLAAEPALRQASRVVRRHADGDGRLRVGPAPAPRRRDRVLRHLPRHRRGLGRGSGAAAGDAGGRDRSRHVCAPAPRARASISRSGAWARSWHWARPRAAPSSRSTSRASIRTARTARTRSWRSPRLMRWRRSRSNRSPWRSCGTIR